MDLDADRRLHAGEPERAGGQAGAADGDAEHPELRVLVLPRPLRAADRVDFAAVDDARLHDFLADVYARKGMHREAIAEEQKYLSLAGDEEAAEELGRDYAASGYDEAMKALYRKTLAFSEEVAKYAYVSPIDFAVLYAHLGQMDEAFVWLEKAFEERQTGLVQLHVDPQFEPLRPDPRFGEMVRRVRDVAARERAAV